MLTVRILTLVAVLLAVICAVLAVQWRDQRDVASCWRAAAMFQLMPEDNCGEGA